MSGLIAFANPAILLSLIALPAIWWLLRLTPPRPKSEIFPPLRILASVLRREETPARSPWWLTLLRMALAAAIVLALADPVIDPRTGSLRSGGPLVLLVDNGWAAAPDWQRRVETAGLLISDAETADLPVAIAFTAGTGQTAQAAVPGTPAKAREQLAAAAPRPLVPDRKRAAAALAETLNGTRPGTLALISDGIAAPGDDEALTALAALAPQELRLIEGDGANALALTGAENRSNAMVVTATRLSDTAPARFTLHGRDSRGRSLASAPLEFAPGVKTATAELAAPFELRNDFARLAIDELATAGATRLLDDGSRRRRVALLAGEAGSDVQPLLQPLYYLGRALEPYADLVRAGGSDLSAAIRDLMTTNPSAIILADIGRLPADAYEPLQQWLARGGLLIRFAGPRLAAAPADDPLIPVQLRQGERLLGGAMSWSQPQKLADFPEAGPFAGPFAGMPRADDITVTRQVLAEPVPDLAARTWASLADGTPFVTTRQVEAGRIVLFHTSAEASWSNLPLSGHFVEMLRRLVQLARAGGASADAAQGSTATLAPWQLLTADGRLTSETGTAKPLPIGTGATPAASFDHPPGLYGSEDGFTAVNLFAPGTELSPFTAEAEGLTPAREQLAGGQSLSLRGPLFAGALALLLIDSLIVLFLNGAFSRPLRRAPAALILTLALFPLLPLLPMDAARAQEAASGSTAKAGDEVILERLETTRLAYIVTGEAEVDNVSQRGLAGLSEFLTYRTTLEPGAPVGLDPEKDELAFYPIIYWPVSASAPMPSQAAISRIDAYMRNGGTVLFDTRDQFAALDGFGTSENGERLQAILADIDIPPLEPVPPDHVLTRSFYLLTGFPGRYLGSPLWVEARQQAISNGTGLTSGGDGVSPILITGNDLAGAWAVDGFGMPLLPMVPPDETQREYAYRAGVNIMMYMLTGNYKADQVHVPALLERLGQ